MKLIEIDVNGMKYPIHAVPDIPLLFVLRDEIGLTGRKCKPSLAFTFLAWIWQYTGFFILNFPWWL